MRNAHLPAVSSHLYNIGNNEVQIPNLDVSMSTDGKINVHGSSFYLDSKVFNDGNQLRDIGSFAIPFQSLVNYQPASVNPQLHGNKSIKLASCCSFFSLCQLPSLFTLLLSQVLFLLYLYIHQIEFVFLLTGYQSITSTCNNVSQQAMLLGKKAYFPEVQMDFQAMRLRKRSIEVSNLLPQRSPTDLIKNKTVLSTWRNNKRMKADSPEAPWNHQVKESIHIQEQKFQVPLRRSQRLSDKITALQKLVSPYGKTDTASVLQEASLYIKLLQEQIQMLTSSYNSARPVQQSLQEIDGKMVDLRSRGLRLVPISFLQKMTQQQGHLDPISYSRNNDLGRYF